LSLCGQQAGIRSNAVIETIKKLIRTSFEVAWAGVLLLLPITSLPLLSRLAGTTMVAPASIIPLGWLTLWFTYYIFKKGILPREVLPFLLFATIAVISCAYAFFIRIPSFKGEIFFNKEIEIILTLLIGTAFYFLTSSWLVNSSTKLIYALKLINISGLVLLSWTLVQAVFIYFFHGEYPTVLVNFQMLFSTRALFPNRMTGFAFEPSWFAQQLNLLYIPLWLAATITRFSAFRFRIWKVSLENIFLGIGTILLFLSSRIGTLSFLAILLFLGIYVNINFARSMQKWTVIKFAKFRPFQQKTLHHLLSTGIVIVFLGMYTLGTVVLVYILSHFDVRLARFFEITSLGQFKQISGNIYALFNYLAFAERYVYWVGGWKVFNLHPFLGVGLGNSGFYFQETLPAYSWSLPEVLNVLYRSTIIPNIKSLWIRLLAETGIVGFSAFIVWLNVVFKSGWALKRNSSRLIRTIGWFGIFVLVALVFEGFSTDTFALPYLWISLGIVCAVAASVRRSKSSESNG
jgi:hypothetical protein